MFPGTPRAVSAPGIVGVLPSPDPGRVLFQDANLKWYIAALDSASSHTPALGLTENDQVSRWGSDGRTVYAIQRNHVPNPVEAIDVVTGKRRPVTLLDPKMPGVLYIRSMAITPDGSAYAYGALTYISRLYTMEGAR